MDIMKDDTWHAKVEAYGIGEPKLFSGAIVNIYRDIMLWQRVTQLKPGPHGKEFIITFRNQPMSEDKEGNDMISQAVMNELLEGAEKSDLTMEEIMAQYHNPWASDSLYNRYLTLAATQPNYESSPEEYHRLWDYFEEKYPEHWRTLKKRSM